MKLHYATISETGRHSNNEDAFRTVNITPMWVTARCYRGNCSGHNAVQIDFMCEKQGDDNYTAVLIEVND